MAKVVTLGEIMLRLSPPGYERFTQASDFHVCYGGAEANVAASLTQFGHEVSFITKVPDNDLGQAAIRTLRGLGIDCSQIAGAEIDSAFIFWKTAPLSVLPASSMTGRIPLLRRRTSMNLILIPFLPGRICFICPASARC